MNTSETNLFADEPTPTPLIYIDHRETVARKKLGALPDSWQIFKWNCIGTDAVEITGSETKMITKGPRKGRLKWLGERKVAVVTKGERETEEARYSADTGLCARCCGNKIVPSSWGAEGTKYRECTSCKGTGKK